MGYHVAHKWRVIAPPGIEKTLKHLPKKVGLLFEALLTDLENEGPFPKGWKVKHLSGSWKGCLRVQLKREYRTIYRYESDTITIFVERVGHRKEIYGL